MATTATVDRRLSRAAYRQKQSKFLGRCSDAVYPSRHLLWGRDQALFHHAAGDLENVCLCGGSFDAEQIDFSFRGPS